MSRFIKTVVDKRYEQYVKGYAEGRERITRGFLSDEDTIIHRKLRFNKTHSKSFRDGYRDGYNDCLETLRMD